MNKNLQRSCRSFKALKIPSLLRATLVLSCISLHAVEPAPVVATLETPERMIQLGEGHWFIDFGNATFGNVELYDEDLRGQTGVRVHMGEAISGEDRVHRNPGGTVRYQSHEVTLGWKPVSPKLDWAPPHWMKDGWLEPDREVGEIMPFRYVEIEGAPETFSEDDITRITWTVALDPEASYFKSSDEALVSVWDLCKHSIRATSFLGIYVDGDRERRPYEADILINQLSHFAVDAHYATAKASLEHLMDYPTWPTEWRIQTPIIAWQHYLWSGDDSFVRANFEKLKSRGIIHKRNEDGFFLGFLDGPVKDIVDWPAGERDDYDMSMPVKSVVTAFHYRSLIDLAQIARHLGDVSEADRLLELAAQTRESFNEQLWDESRGCYIDGLDPKTGRKSSHASAHANFFPLALGLVPEERVERVADFLETKGMACSVYGAQFLLEALYLAGRDEAALQLLTSDSLRSWRNMIEKVGSTVTLEAWDPSLKPNLDWNHAWGAAPANIIARYLMGIEPLEPGFKRFRVKPQTGSLADAEIKSPTPHGPIYLRIEDSSGFLAKVVVPEGTAAEFYLPKDNGFSLQDVYGKEAEPRLLRTENGRPVIGLLPGVWTVSQ